MGSKLVDDQGIVPGADNGSSPPDRVDLPARDRIAAEVVELGEALFDAVVDVAIARPSGQGEPAESFPEGDIRAAAAEFFAVLRILLEGDRSHAGDDLRRHGAP